MWAEVEIRGCVTQMAGLPNLVPSLRLQQDTAENVYRAAAGLHVSQGKETWTS